MLQTSIQQHLELTKQQQGETQKRIQELGVESDDEEDEGLQRAAALQEVERRSKLLEEDQVSSGITYGQVRSHITQQTIIDVVTSEDSTAQVGLPESVVGMIHQRIGNVMTTKRSKARVGVFPGNLDVNDFL